MTEDPFSVAGAIRTDDHEIPEPELLDEDIQNARVQISGYLDLEDLL